MRRDPGDRRRERVARGSSTGRAPRPAIGAPTDRPGRIAERFVGAGRARHPPRRLRRRRSGAPANLEAVGARRVAGRRPAPAGRRARGGRSDPRSRSPPARRASCSRSRIVERPDALRDCLGGRRRLARRRPRPAAGSARRVPVAPRPSAPTLESLVEELVAAGVRRFVLSHGGARAGRRRSSPARPDARRRRPRRGRRHRSRRHPRLRDAGVAGVILGEALLSGAIDFPRPGGRRMTPPHLPSVLVAVARGRRCSSPRAPAASPRRPRRRPAAPPRPPAAAPTPSASARRRARRGCPTTQPAAARRPARPAP